MDLITDQERQIQLHRALITNGEVTIENGKKRGILMEAGRKLEEDAEIEVEKAREVMRKVLMANKAKADEHASLVNGNEMEANRLKDEKTALLGELATIEPFVILPELHMHSKNVRYVVLDKSIPVLSPEFFMLISLHLPAKDQLTLRSLNKTIRSVIPKVLRLNFQYFKESFDMLVKGFKKVVLTSEIPVNFTLDPKVVEMNPYGVLALAARLLGGIYPHNNHIAAIHPLLGPSLKVAVSEIMKRNHLHLKFKLLTLHIATFANCPAAIEFLLSSTENTSREYISCALTRASQAGYNEVCKLFLKDTRVDPAWGDNHAIGLAAQEGRTSTVKLLLEDPRVSPSANLNFCIRIAAERGHVEVVKLLLEDSRVDWKAKNLEALRVAWCHNHFSVVKVLLDHFVAYPVRRREIVEFGDFTEDEDEEEEEEEEEEEDWRRVRGNGGKPHSHLNGSFTS